MSHRWAGVEQPGNLQVRSRICRYRRKAVGSSRVRTGQARGLLDHDRRVPPRNVTVAECLHRCRQGCDGGLGYAGSTRRNLLQVCTVRQIQGYRFRR
jgi:hypothetical protein